MEIRVKSQRKSKCFRACTRGAVSRRINSASRVKNDIPSQITAQAPSKRGAARRVQDWVLLLIVDLAWQLYFGASLMVQPSYGAFPGECLD